MLLFNNIRQKLFKACLSLPTNFYSAKPKPIDMAFNTYENLNTTNVLPPLIIMHGLFGSNQNWRSICNELLKKLQNRKIILVDARNHGESPHTPELRYEDMAADVAQLMKKENLQRASVMGHSMGGRCMMYTALKYPQLIEKVIIVDISPLSTSASLENMVFLLYVLRNVHVSHKFKMSDARKEADKQLAKLGIRNPLLRNFLLLSFIQDSNGRFKWRFNLEAIIKSFASNIINFPNDAAYSKYLGPVLFIGGADSDSISEDQLAKIQNLYFPSAQLIMLQNAGHLIHVDQPAILIDLVVKFLK